MPRIPAISRPHTPAPSISTISGRRGCPQCPTVRRDPLLLPVRRSRRLATLDRSESALCVLLEDRPADGWSIPRRSWTAGDQLKKPAHAACRPGVDGCAVAAEHPYVTPELQAHGMQLGQQVQGAAGLGREWAT